MKTIEMTQEELLEKLGKAEYQSDEYEELAGELTQRPEIEDHEHRGTQRFGDEHGEYFMCEICGQGFRMYIVSMEVGEYDQSHFETGA